MIEFYPMLKKTLVLVFLLLQVFLGMGASDTLVYKNPHAIAAVKTWGLAKDQTNQTTIQQVVLHPFKVKENNGITVSDATFWARFYVQNQSSIDSVFVSIENPTLGNCVFYTLIDGKVVDSLELGRQFPFYNRTLPLVNMVYNVPVKMGQTAAVYVRIKSAGPLHLPIFVASGEVFTQRESFNNLIFGIYIGIIFIMVLYHIFISFTVDDTSYVYYIFFIFFVGLTQMVLRGYGAKYVWPSNLLVSVASTNIVGVLSGVATALFVKNFLQTKNLAPFIDRLLNVLLGLYGLATIAQFTGHRYLAFNLINGVAVVGSIAAIVAGMMAYRKKLRSSIFFLFAFSVFLLAVVIYVFRTNGILPYNLLTDYILEIGSVVQITLLSLALADKINTYRSVQEQTRRENARLIQEQNITLEKEVKVRTEELEHINEELKVAMKRIQSTQAKLIDTEKMASLGQLTAGIAHEINNPINFVTSNIRPLEADVKDLSTIIKMYEDLDLGSDVQAQIAKIEAFKEDIDLTYLHEEIATLLSGIKEGAQRTAEIVKGLRNFARVDESNWKAVNLNEGIDSTLLLIKSTFPQNFQLVKELGDLPKIECAPGKINQVFMNIMTNAVQAVGEKKDSTEPGLLEIKTWAAGEFVHISIRDNGGGMPKENIGRIFDPFFTTKDVGEGTGLGLSIVKGIIDNHDGNIQVDSVAGEGTVFIISLPIHKLDANGRD